jgi:dATP pyrophosphohydrolase
MAERRITRQPRNVLVYPFVRASTAPLFLILKRADNGIWQGVSGGVEGEETSVETAIRELGEELGLTDPPPILPLTMFSGQRRTDFSVHRVWPEGVYIVEKRFYAVDLSERGTHVTLSDEHTECRWLSFDEAHDLIEYSDDRTGLWELHRRILSEDLPHAVD